MGLQPWTHHCIPQPLLLIVLMLIAVSASLINASDTTEKVDQITAPPVPDPSVKCTTCPCYPCSDQHLPPPPPPPPPAAQYCGQGVPPPPRFIYITEPPPPRFTYITSDPGSLYASDPLNLGFYSAAGRNVITRFMILVGCGALEVLIMGFW